MDDVELLFCPMLHLWSYFKQKERLAKLSAEHLNKLEKYRRLFQAMEEFHCESERLQAKQDG